MRILLAALFILGVSLPARAEFIRMKDGREFEGVILQETPDSVKIRERCGDSIIEIDYPRSDIERIGPPADEEQEGGQQSAKTIPEQGAQIEEDPAYEQGIDRIISLVSSLKNSWEADRPNCVSSRAWLKDASPAIRDFKERYSRSKRISYSYMKLALLKLSNFFSCVGDIEDKQSVYKENIRPDTPESVKASLKESIAEYERMACESLNLAGQYLNMAKAKTLK